MGLGCWSEMAKGSLKAGAMARIYICIEPDQAAAEEQRKVDLAAPGLTSEEILTLYRFIPF